MTEQQFREQYKRAFSSLHASDGFEEKVVNTMMSRNQKRWNKGLAAAGAAAVLALTGTTVYAQNVGGIQRKMQIWLDGEKTTATVDLNDDGTYTIYDADGNEAESGGGIVLGKFGQPDRPLTAEEMQEDLAERITMDESDGRYYLMWHNKKVDITDDFAEDGYAYVLLSDGNETMYVTADKDGGLASSPDRYQIPGKDFSDR